MYFCLGQQNGLDVKNKGLKIEFFKRYISSYFNYIIIKAYEPLGKKGDLEHSNEKTIILPNIRREGIRAICKVKLYLRMVGCSKRFYENPLLNWILNNFLQHCLNEKSKVNNESIVDKVTGRDIPSKAI